MCWLDFLAVGGLLGSPQVALLGAPPVHEARQALHASSPILARSCLLMGIRQAANVAYGAEAQLQGCKASCSNNPPAGHTKLRG